MDNKTKDMLYQNFKDCIYYGYFFKSCKKFGWCNESIKKYGISKVKEVYNKALEVMNNE